MKRMKRFISVFLAVFILGTVCVMNIAAAGTGCSVRWQVRGDESQRSAVGRSNSEATVIIDSDYTTSSFDSPPRETGAIFVSADEDTPYRDVVIGIQWWTEGILSFKKADIIMYDGRLGNLGMNMNDVRFPISSKTYTVNNTHKNGDGHFTYYMSNADVGIRSRYEATFTNWSY